MRLLGWRMGSQAVIYAALPLTSKGPFSLAQMLWSCALPPDGQIPFRGDIPTTTNLTFNLSKIFFFFLSCACGHIMKQMKDSPTSTVSSEMGLIGRRFNPGRRWLLPVFRTSGEDTLQGSLTPFKKHYLSHTIGLHTVPENVLKYVNCEQTSRNTDLLWSNYNEMKELNSRGSSERLITKWKRNCS